MTQSFGDALVPLSTTERLTRACLDLLANSAVGAPSPADDLAAWLNAHWAQRGWLSDGERPLWDLAITIWRGGGLSRLDDTNRAAVAAIITDWLTA